MSDIHEPVVNWVVFAVLIPLIVGSLVAFPFWWKRKPTIGNIVGSFAIAGVIFVLIWQQYGALIRAQTDCNTLWVPDCNGITGVSQYSTYLILVLMGWVDVFFLLILSGIVEDRLRPRWLDTSKL